MNKWTQLYRLEIALVASIRVAGMRFPFYCQSDECCDRINVCNFAMLAYARPAREFLSETI